MKVLDLQCGQMHVFEGWFASENDFADQHARGLVTCPMCGDGSVTKKLSAPRFNLGRARELAQSPKQEVVAAVGDDQQALQATLLKANVRAPFDGKLGLSSITVGTYVSPNTPVVTLARTRPVKIDCAVPGRFAARVRVGDVVRATDEATAKEYTAKVYAVNPELDPVSRTLQARARFANRNDELQPGAFVKVRLDLGETTDALQIPTEAVVPVAAGYQVFVVKNGKATTKDIKIGLRSDKLIQVLSGLAVGDSVVRSGVLQIKVGDAVKAGQQ